MREPPVRSGLHATRPDFCNGAILGAYLIRQGLALAGPDAPFEYRALERIAQTNGLGILPQHCCRIGLLDLPLLLPRRLEEITRLH
jgi:hypothetical protein